MALSRLAATRKELDLIERRLIEAARARDASWARIATALGVTSRQAAEQRWLRLCADAGRDPAAARASRKRQQSVDTLPELAELRSAVAAALRYIDCDLSWDSRHPRAILARTSLFEAASAAPSALYALAQHAVDDLAMMPVAAPAFYQLRAALTAAAPK